MFDFNNFKNTINSLNKNEESSKSEKKDDWPLTTLTNLPNSIFSRIEDGRYVLCLDDSEKEFVKTMCCNQDDPIKAITDAIGPEKIQVLDELPNEGNFKTYKEYEQYKESEILKREKEKLEQIKLLQELGGEVLEYNRFIKYPNTKEEWIDVLKEKDVYLIKGGEKMLEKMQTSKLPEGQKFIKFTVGDLFEDEIPHTYEEICNKAQEIGLELCEQDDGPKLRLGFEDKVNVPFRIAMKAIASDNLFLIWMLYRDDYGQKALDSYFGGGSNNYGSNYQFVFRLPN